LVAEQSKKETDQDATKLKNLKESVATKAEALPSNFDKKMAEDVVNDAIAL